MRCPSRQSSISGILDESQCTSNQSQYSGLENNSPIQTPIPISFSNEFEKEKAFLPVTSLLPTQSSAMAVYLNAAAVAAVQQSHLLLAHPLVTTPSSIQQTRRFPKPTANDSKSQASLENERIHDIDSMESASNSSTHFLKTDSNQSISVEKLNDNSEQFSYELEEYKETSNESINSPLDLSLSKDRKREMSYEKLNSPNRKIVRMNAIKSTKFDVLVPTISNYIESMNTGKSSQESLPKISQTFGSNTKEKLNNFIITNNICAAEQNTPFKLEGMNIVNNSSTRHNAWQSHWLSKGVDVVKNILKCVWCKKSFPSLDLLTHHLQETHNCGISSIRGSYTINNNENQPAQNSVGSPQNNLVSHMYQKSPVSEKKADHNLEIKESLPLPRKLVRGQDIWIGKGAEQTRQILKCMWCGQSFRTLAEMTSHMQETQHYTNIVSQEQIISWKSSDEKKINLGCNERKLSTSKSQPIVKSETNLTVKNILTCEVCNQSFTSLKELSSHKIQNNHSSLVNGIQNNKKRCKQTREKRKRSLPVRKLLEMERAEFNCKSNESLLPPIDLTSARKISCEKCENKIDAAHFVKHIRQCLGNTIFNLSVQEFFKLQNDCVTNEKCTLGLNYDEIKNKTNYEKFTNAKHNTGDSNSKPSVLNAIEELIEKSFEKHSHKKNSFIPYKSSILKKLRFDNNTIYSQFQHVNSEVINLQSSSKRNRSESESSSISDRCVSYLDTHKNTRRFENYEIPNLKQSPNFEFNKQQELLLSNTNEDIIPKPPNTLDLPNSRISVGLDTSIYTKNVSPSNDELMTSYIPKINELKKSLIPENCLNALTSMFDNLNNKQPNHITNNNNIDKKCRSINNNSELNTNAHPLVALQKLCEVNNNSLNSNMEHGNKNDQLINQVEVAFHCPYSDFETSSEVRVSKESTCHEIKSFSKDIDTDSQSSVSVKLQAPDTSPLSMVSQKTINRRVIKDNPIYCYNTSINKSQSNSSTQSKFLKYTELAKQLSSKNC